MAETKLIRCAGTVHHPYGPVRCSATTPVDGPDMKEGWTHQKFGAYCPDHKPVRRGRAS